MAEDLGEKTEDATPKRKKDARDKGNLAKSTDFSAVFMLGMSTVALALFGFTALERAGELVTEALDWSLRGDPVDPGEAMNLIPQAGLSYVRMTAPVIAIIFAAALVSQLMQVGLLLAPKVLQPSLSKISPMKGAKRIFGLSGVFKAGLDILKVVVVVGVSIIAINLYKERVAVLPHLDLMQAVKSIADMMLWITIKLLAVLLLIGLLDLWYQRWKHTRDLRMSKQEVKDERRSADGDPKVKQKRMQMAQQIAMQRIGASVPKADVIVTNPEHYSIAIRYDQETMAAPIVVAKGVDALAFRIRQIALMHDIPIVERPPLARGLYREVEIGHPIPVDFYEAVAEVLAYVYRLSGQEAVA